MKNRNCPNKDACWDYDASNCTGCAIGEKFSRLTRQNKKLKAENAELRARLEKAVELPVKVGDTVYFIPTYNGKPIWGVQRGIVQMVGITRQGYHVKIRDRADFNKTYMFRKSAFLSKEQAEARLSELKGEEP